MNAARSAIQVNYADKMKSKRQELLLLLLLWISAAITVSKGMRNSNHAWHEHRVVINQCEGVRILRKRR